MWARCARLGRHAVPHLTMPSFFEGQVHEPSPDRCWERDTHRQSPGGPWRALHAVPSCIGGLGLDVTWSPLDRASRRRETGASADRVWSGVALCFRAWSARWLLRRTRG